MEVKQGAASVRARCRADGGPERRLAAQPCAGAVQRRRRLSRCTDRSAGGCADRHTVSTTRAQACSGLDTAEALPPRCKPWRSRGRRWRGPAARATERPCRTTLPPQRRAGDAARRLWETARARATAAGHRSTPAAGSAGAGAGQLQREILGRVLEGHDDHRDIAGGRRREL